MPLAPARTYRNIAALPEINKHQFIFWLLWPFGALLYALKNFRKPSSKTLFWLFCVYFGFVFVYADPFGQGGADSASYALDLIELHARQHSFTELWSSIYNVNTSRLDIYQPLLTWLISLFTGNPAFLFAAFAAVFGYFYMRNIWMILNQLSVKVDVLLFLFIISCALINPLWNINGVRMWTAAQVFLFGNLLLFLNNDKRGLWWSASSILFHFSFMFPVALLLVWPLLPRKAGLLFGFYMATAFVGEIEMSAVRNLLSFLPDIFQARVEIYANETYVASLSKARVSQAVWHQVFAGKASRWLTYAWIIMVFIKRNEWSAKHKAYFHIFLFALFLGGFANLASHVPSGGRFVVLSKSLFYALFVLLLGKNYLQLPWLKWISLPLLAFAVIFQIRVGFDYIGFLAVAGNPFFAPFFDTQTALIDFVKSLF